MSLSFHLLITIFAYLVLPLLLEFSAVIQKKVLRIKFYFGCKNSLEAPMRIKYEQEMSEGRQVRGDDEQGR